MTDLKNRKSLEEKLAHLVQEGPAPCALDYAQLIEINHCLSIENKRLRIRVDHLEAQKEQLLQQIRRK